MQTLPHDLYRAAQVRELDRLAIEQCGIAGGMLMERAGAAAFALLRRCWPQVRRIGVVCGVGNNGGDGFVLARLAREAGLEVMLYQVGEAARLRGDALAASRAVGMAAQPLVAGALRHCDVVVDALLGTGLSGEVRDEWHRAIAAINDSGRPVLALDIPSGLDADSGVPQGCAVRAEATITFIGLKQGLLTGAGPALCGALHFADLAVPSEVYVRVAAAARRLDLAQFRSLLVPRARDAHKGDFGHVLVVGGECGYAGAVRLAAEAAARSGAGLVSVATRVAHAAAITAARPELMCHGVESAAELEPLLRRATVVVVGPGLGQGAWGQRMLGRLLQVRQPLVMDADALNLLALEPVRRDDWILTPHPGEAGRLLGEDATDVQRDRFAAAIGLQASYGGVVVLKGPGSLVLGDDGMPGICNGGNPGMASGGMGDVLSGILGALIAQGLSLRDAAGVGVCLHAAAADAAVQMAGERGLLASDLFPHLRQLINPSY
jgi:NAD(P)H-hydrate epimerase